MRCPSCQFDHTASSGRLLSLAPTYGIRRTSAGVGVAMSIFRPGYVVAKERVETVETGRFVKCLACGSDFGVDYEGVFVPVVQPAQAQVAQVPRPERTISDVSAKPEKPMRPVHLPDEDLAPAPNFDE